MMMNISKTSRSIHPRTDNPRSKESLEIYLSEGRAGWFTPRTLWNTKLSSMSDLSRIISTNNCLRKKKKEKKIRTVAKKSEKLRINLDRPFQCTWKMILPNSIDNGLSQGLLGGGNCCSRKLEQRRYEPIRISDTTIERIKEIEEGAENGRYDLIFRALGKIHEWEDTDRHLDIAIKIIRVLCKDTLQTLPYLLRERIIEKLPALLFHILRSPNLTMTRELRREMLEGILNLQIIDGEVGALEIAYYKGLCLLMIKQFPSPKDWREVAKTIGDFMNIISKAFFCPFIIGIETIGSIYSLGNEVYKLFEKKKEGSLLTEYVRIHLLKVGVLNGIDKCLNEMINTAKNKNLNIFSRKTCLMCVKELMMSIREGNLSIKLEDFLMDLFEDEELQNMSIRVCLALDSRYARALHRIIEESRKLRPDTSDVLKKTLLMDHEKIREDLKKADINWDAYAGISPTNYSNTLRVFKNWCDMTEDTYVDVEVLEKSLSSTESFPILSKVFEFLEDSTLKVLLLLGNSGSGKTLFCHRLGKHLLESYNDYFPLYGSLPMIENTKNGIARYCFEKCNLSSEELVNRKLLFILDGFDEITEKVNLIETNSFFDRFSNCKVFITCRTHKVNSLQSFVSHASGAPRTNELKILHIQPFCNNKIKIFIAKVYKKQSLSCEEEKNQKKRYTPQQTWQRIQSISKLKAMLKDPIMLQICLGSNILDQIGPENSNRFDIYQKCMQSYSNENIRKLRNIGIITKVDEYTHLCIEYAFVILKNGKIETNFDKEDRQKLLNAGCPVKGISFNEEGETSGLTFIHPSIYEYFVALQFREIMVSLYAQQPEEFTHEMLSQLNEAFICDKKGILSFIENYLNQEHKEILLSIVQIKMPEFTVASANAITILNYSGYSFVGRDMKGIQIERADLSGANLTRADLSGSNMKGVNLTDTCLDLTDLCNCDLRDTIFGERVPLQGYSSKISCVGFSPDGRCIVFGIEDKMVRVWNMQKSSIPNNMQKFSITKYPQGHDKKVSCASYSPDGRYIASGSFDMTVIVWDVETSSLLSTLKGHSGFVKSVSFSPDGRYIASGSQDKTIIVWEMNKFSTLCIFQGHTDIVTCVSYSPDGRYIASGSWDSTVRIWDVERYFVTIILRGHSRPVNSVSFSPDGSYVASGSQDKTIRIWDVKTSSELYTLHGHFLSVTCVSFSPNGEYIASGSWDKTIRIWDTKKSSTLYALHGHYKKISSINFSLDGKYIASGSDDGTVRIWDIDKSAPIHNLHGHYLSATCVSFSSNGEFVASGSENGTVKVWDMKTSSTLFTLQASSDKVSSVSFSPDGRYVASGSWDKTVKLWDVETSSIRDTLHGHYQRVNALCFSPNGRYIASGSDDMTVIIWDIGTPSTFRTLQGHSDHVISVSYSPDGRYLISGSKDMTIIIWDAEASSVLKYFQCNDEKVTCISFSSEGKYVVSGSEENTVRIWDADTSSCIHTMRGHSARVNCVSFSPNGRYIASGSNDMTIKFWDAKNSSCLYTIDGHSDRVTCISFSSDGRYIASGSEDSTVRLWGTYQIPILFTGHKKNQPKKQAKNNPEHSIVPSQFTYSSDEITLVESRNNKIIKATNLLNGEKEPEYKLGARISDYPDLKVEEDSRIDLFPLHAEFSNRPRAYGVIFNGVLINKRNLELLYYKKYNLR